jgi:hypothetical protein
MNSGRCKTESATLIDDQLYRKTIAQFVKDFNNQELAPKKDSSNAER